MSEEQKAPAVEAPAAVQSNGQFQTAKEKELYVQTVSLRKQLSLLKKTNAQLRIQIADLEEQALEFEVTQNKDWLVAEGYMQLKPTQVPQGG